MNVNTNAMKKIILIFSIITFTLISASAQQLTKLWATDAVLKVPESVLIDSKNERIYVSNIDGKGPWDKDGKGSIALLTMSGKVLNPEWVKGLHCPKGMTMVEGYLFVADLDSILIVDPFTAKVIKKIGIEGGEGFNDITSDKRGDLYVSDSKTKKIHYINRTRTTLYVKDLKGPNGVLYADKNFYFVDAGSFYKLGKDNEKILIADGLEPSTDGIEQVDENTFLVSCWIGTIWLVKTNGEKKLLLDTRQDGYNAADIAFDKKKSILYVPTFWKNQVVAYELK